MATITKSIGTNARDYSTITSWEAALGGAAGGSGNDAIGECYADSTFSERVIINDTTPNSITVRAATGEGHDGTEGTGVIVANNTGGTWGTLNASTTKPVTLQGLDISGMSTSGQNAVRCTSSGAVVVSRCILRDCDDAGFNSGSSGSVRFQNCIAYMLNISGVQGDAGDTDRFEVLNCTIVKDPANDVDNGRVGCRYTLAKNTIAMHFGPTSSFADFLNADPASNYNASHDTSSPGANSLDNLVAANLFVSVVAGAEDLHLKEGAGCIDAGTSLSGTFTDDIDGQTRSGAWDIGADEFQAGGGSNNELPAKFMHYQRMMAR